MAFVALHSTVKVWNPFVKTTSISFFVPYSSLHVTSTPCTRHCHKTANKENTNAKKYPDTIKKSNCHIILIKLSFLFFSHVSIFVITSFAKSSMWTPKRKQIFFNVFKSGSLTSLSQFDSACRVTFNFPASSSCVIPDCVRR